jgi:hypothetical protein
LVVVAGLDAWCRAQLTAFAGGRELPWVNSTPDRLAADLAALVADPGRRAALGAQGRRFMEEVWSESRLARTLAAFYET